MSNSAMASPVKKSAALRFSMKIIQLPNVVPVLQRDVISAIPHHPQQGLLASADLTANGHEPVSAL